MSVPNAQGAYYVVENIFTPTAADSQIVYFYGNGSGADITITLIRHAGVD